MKSLITPYRLQTFCPIMRRKSALWQRNTSSTLVVTMKQTETNFFVIHFIKRTILLHLLTNFKRGKILPKIIQTSGKDPYRKSVFCKTLSALPWTQLY